MNNFSVDVHRDGNRCVMLVHGEIDVVHAPDLQSIGLLALSSATDTMPIVVDLSRVEFIDSTGLGALVAIRNAAQKSGRDVHIRRPSARVQRILEITGLDAVFVVDDVADDATSPAKN